MFIVIYEFKVKVGAEASFRDGWARVTDAIRGQRGGLGSRLHAGPESTMIAYAQWPDEATFDRSSALGPLTGEPGSQMMRDGLAGPVRIVYKLQVLDDRLTGFQPVSDPRAS